VISRDSDFVVMDCPYLPLHLLTPQAPPGPRGSAPAFFLPRDRFSEVMHQT
jgi:hypothetical protein